MAVHTPLSQQQLADLLQPFQLGELINYSGISDGMENTNYFIRIKNLSTASITDYVLTIFEQITYHEVSFYLDLMAHMAHGGLPVAKPVNLANEKSFIRITENGKPAAVVGKLPGSHVLTPAPPHCFAVGKALAQQHRLCRNFPFRGTQQLQTILDHGKTLLKSVSADDRFLFDNAIRSGEDLLANIVLPRGIIHGDLFRDNVLFDDNKISGLLDFYNATYAPLLIDIAITVNDWCVNQDSTTDPVREHALLAGYQSVRPLHAEEKQQWQHSLCFAALRFWISRLRFQQQQRDTPDGAHFPAKDPDEYRNRYRFLVQSCQ